MVYVLAYSNWFGPSKKVHNLSRPLVSSLCLVNGVQPRVSTVSAGELCVQPEAVNYTTQESL